MPVYYYANVIYQFSHALPLYEKYKGTYVVKNLKNYYWFKRYLKNTARFGEKTLFNTPEIIVTGKNKLKDLPPGIIIFFANAIVPEDDYSDFTTIFYEHGSSDKKYSAGRSEGADKIEKYDYIFLWGEKNRQKITDLDIKIPEEKYIEIGGFRFDKYLDSEALKKEQIKRLKIKDTKRKTILYAPTWRFGKGTLKQFGAYFAKEITKKYNLIIRPHSHDSFDGQWIYYLSKLKGVKNLYFSQPNAIVQSDILFDFAISDLLIGDMSSVVYEYLITKKPIILVENNYKNRHIMAKELNIYDHVAKFEEGMDINKIIEQSFNSEYTKPLISLLNHCFYSVNKSSVDKAISFLNKIQENTNVKTN